MSARVLVAYATRYGSTAEVARVIGEVLTDEGAVAKVLSVAETGDLLQFDGLVLGSPVRMGRLLPEALAFLRRHRGELERLWVAYFLTGLTMAVDSPSNRRQAETYLRPLRKIKVPLSTGLFGGMVDHRFLGPLLRLFARLDRSGTLADGDYRDWAAIRKWARGLSGAPIDRSS